MAGNEFIGRQIDFGVAIESVRGTAEATAERSIKKVTCNLIPRSERVVDDSTTGQMEDAERLRTVRRWSEGDIDGVVHVDAIGYFLANLYGDVSSAVVSGVVYDHTFNLEQTISHQSLTLFVKDAGVDQRKVPNGMVSALGIVATTDDYLRATMSFMGKENVSDASSYPALETEYDFISRDIVVKIADTEGGLAGASAINMRSLNLNWNPNVEADWIFGDLSPDEVYNKEFSIDGDFTRKFDDTTFKDLYEADTFKYMSITITGEADIGGGNNPTITILLYKIQISDWNRDSAPGELSIETVNFKAFLNTSDVKQSQIVLRNLVTEYDPS